MFEGGDTRPQRPLGRGLLPTTRTDVHSGEYIYIYTYEYCAVALYIRIKVDAFCCLLLAVIGRG